MGMLARTRPPLALTTIKAEYPEGIAMLSPVVEQVAVVPAVTEPISAGANVQMAPVTGVAVELPLGSCQTWACTVTGEMNDTA